MDRGIDIAEEALCRWADWMRRGDSIAEGYPEKAAGGFIESWIKDDDELAEAADEREFQSVNASVDSLSFMHKRVVYHMHGIGYQVWRFADKDSLYEAAKESFRKIHFCKAK